MIIEQAAQEFYDYSSFIRGYAPKTIRRYKQAINLYCKFAYVEHFDQVTTENIRQLFFHGRTQRAWGVQTFLVYYKSLKVFFRWAGERKYISFNPLDDIEVPRAEKVLPPKLTKQNAQLLLEVVYNYPYKQKFLRYRNHAIFAMFLYAGLRKGELLNLKYADVDVENKTVFVRQGKGNKDRIIPMSQALAYILKKYLEEREVTNKTCPNFFASLHRNAAFTDTGLKRLIEQVHKISNVPFTAHKLRHTFATLMLEGGCDIFSLSKMMGHSAITTTTIYLAASPEHLRSQMVKHPLNNL
jgi:site-specific recombinase XerD